MFDMNGIEVFACGGVGAIVGGILGAVTGLFGGGRRESSSSAPAVIQQPAAPAAPPAPEKPADASAADAAADVKARADEERKRRIAANRNATSTNGGLGATGEAATGTNKLG